MRNYRIRLTTRKAAVMPLFAVILPVLFILCSFAINLAYMQLVSTELKICTDVAAHAGGRAMSIHQDSDEAWDFAIEAGALNTVAGQNLTIARDENHLTFGTSVRANNGFGRYQFNPISKSKVDNGSGRATSIRVTGELDLPLIFTALPGTSSVEASRQSIATQVDRDIALVLDRSGSMLFYQDDEELTEAIWEIYETTETVQELRWFWVFPGVWKQFPVNVQQRLISSSERDDAIQIFSQSGNRVTNPNWLFNSTNNIRIYNRRYSANLRDHLGDWDIEMAEYADDWTSKRSYSESQSTGAPRHSRWALLIEGVERFFDVLNVTDQEELVSLTTFSSSAAVNTGLQSTYDGILDQVKDIRPFGGTAIGQGLQVGLPPIIDGLPDGSRLDSEPPRVFAAKTIVVLTDGANNPGTINPVSVVQNLRNLNNVTIHTVTFTPGADQGAMQEVAELGGGRHYHANDGGVLVDIFEEVANNLPTILTE